MPETPQTGEVIEVHGAVVVVLYGYDQRVIAEKTVERTLRELKRDTSGYLSTPLIQLVESDDAD